MQTESQQILPGQRGISYIEVLVATVIIAISLVPALDALKPGLDGSVLHEQRSREHFVLKGKLEQVLAEPFARLQAAATAAGSETSQTGYSDIVASVPHAVFIWPYDVDDADGDGNVFSGGEVDLLWIRVALIDGSQALETLVTPY